MSRWSTILDWCKVAVLDNATRWNDHGSIIAIVAEGAALADAKIQEAAALMGFPADALPPATLS